MATQPEPRLSPDEYLRAERGSPEKHEYFGGEIFAMGGASESHNVIVVNVVAELRQQLKGRPCKTYPSDLRVKVEATGLYTYPDVTVVCGNARFEDEHVDTLLNPTLIVEVLSPSTEAYDRGKKSEHYRRLDSLREYVLAWQDRCRIEHYVRQPEGHWLLSETTDLDAVVDLPSIGCRLALSEVYDKLVLG
jgi:Uma2 family endonuclease